MIPMLRYALALLMAAGLLSACGEREGGVLSAQARNADGVWSQIPASVKSDLARGVNVSTWFTHRTDATQQPGWPTTNDFSLMRRMGIRHVRLLVDAEWLQLNGAHPRYLEEGITQALNEGLLVVLAMQPSKEHKLQMGEDDSVVELVADIWRQTASQFKTVAHDRLLFEVLNEPEIEDVARVRVIQKKLIEAVREISPERIVAVGGAHYSDIDDLVNMAPLDVRGVIYSFHFYEPHNFTHQGAGWGWHMWMVFHNIPYPSTPENVEPVVEKLTPLAREHIAWYGQQEWNKKKLAEFIDQAADWSKRHNLPVWCSEFGVLRDVAPSASRRAWLNDARSLFEERNMAWTYFDWWGHFGLVTGPQDARQIDEDAQAGLALKLTQTTP